MKIDFINKPYKEFFRHRVSTEKKILDSQTESKLTKKELIKKASASLLIIILILSSCENKEIDECGCVKIVEEQGVEVLFHPNGLPYTSTKYKKLYEEDTFCQDEYNRKNVGGILFHSVKCN